MKKPAPVVVDVPEDDSPSWGKVGTIAIIGFVVGVAWPRLTGVKLGPSAPSESTQAAAGSSQRAPEAPHEIPLSAQAPNTKPSASASASSRPPSVPSVVSVNVGPGAVVSCKTSDGEARKGTKECGPSGFDAVAVPRLKNLGQCAAAANEKGKLSAVFTVDYGGGRMDMSLGKSSTVQNPEAFLGCMRTEFNGVVLKGLSHEHPRYVVAYGVTFEAPKDEPKADPGKTGDAKPNDGKTESGSAVVTWETALLRDAPKTGAVVVRLPRGTKVTIQSSRDGWFKVTCPEGEGWVYRGAIGK